MKVKDMIDTMEKLLPILKEYENVHVHDMLDDIYKKVKNDPQPSQPSQPKPHTTTTEKTTTNTDINCANIISAIETLDKDDITQYLHKYKKDELIAIGKEIGLHLKKRDKKALLIEAIADHFSFIQLNKKIANREVDQKIFN
ncbi:hypothetical protein [Texcoconibacillus texcoconensis]|uniref:Uncharacterized protein n=1 Tax=Texcoconibacillus texcoconensis TaxID=1095777 RepID=A0A840QMA0_9BACI|nr:hypothetical protein [Texcoconibacillus texcoconensis]MBB5172486.1 hypothetical protein [Texcoconibacillus texcoconensis]